MEITQTQAQTAAQLALVAVEAELARTGEDPIAPDEVDELLFHLADICEDYPSESPKNHALLLLYPQPTFYSKVAN